MKWERFFNYLSRINAVGIFLCLMFVIGAVAYNHWQSRKFGAGPPKSSQSEWRTDDFRDVLYNGTQFNTSDGSLVAYSVRGAEDMEGRQPGSNVSFVNMKTGKSVLLAPEGSSVINWDVVFAHDQSDHVNTSDNPAIAYIAQVSNSEQFKKGRMDLVVGTFPDLRQSTVARDTLAVDLPTIHGEGSLAMVMWPEEDTAMFVTIDLTSGKVISRKKVPLPHISSNMTIGAPKINGLGSSLQSVPYDH